VIALLSAPVLIGLVLCPVADRLARSLQPGWAVPLLAGPASWTAALVLAAWGDGLVEIAEAVYARR
jgi:hypothetical protein